MGRVGGLSSMTLLDLQVTQRGTNSRVIDTKRVPLDHLVQEVQAAKIEIVTLSS